MNFQNFNKSFSFIAKCNRVYLFLHNSSRALVQMRLFKLQDVNLKYILNLEPDRLLATYVIDVGLPIKKDQYGKRENIRFDGKIWESPGESISSHIHYLIF